MSDADPEIYSILVLSILHIPPSDRQRLLEDDRRYPLLFRNEYDGVFACRQPDLDEYRASPRSFPDWSEALWDCLEYGLEHKCSYLIFSSDAEPRADLKQFTSSEETVST